MRRAYDICEFVVFNLMIGIIYGAMLAILIAGLIAAVELTTTLFSPPTNIEVQSIEPPLSSELPQ